MSQYFFFYITFLFKIYFEFYNISLYQKNQKSTKEHSNFKKKLNVCSKRVWLLSVEDLNYFNTKIYKISKIIFLDLKIIPKNIEPLIKIMSAKLIVKKKILNKIKFFKKEREYANQVLASISQYECLGVFIYDKKHNVNIKESPDTRVKIFYELSKNNKNILIVHK